MDEFCGWTIYQYPRDFPRHYVVRMWMVEETRVLMWTIGVLCDTLEEARAQIPQGTIRMPREPEDDPVIYETWI